MVEIALLVRVLFGVGGLRGELLLRQRVRSVLAKHLIRIRNVGKSFLSSRHTVFVRMVLECHSLKGLFDGVFIVCGLDSQYFMRISFPELPSHLFDLHSDNNSVCVCIFGYNTISSQDWFGITGRFEASQSNSNPSKNEGSWPGNIQ